MSDRILFLLGLGGIVSASVEKNWMALVWCLAYTLSILRHILKDEND